MSFTGSSGSLILLSEVCLYLSLLGSLDGSKVPFGSPYYLLSLGKEGPKASGQFQELPEASVLLPIDLRSFPLEDPES